jgi:hypothetical protein
MGALNHDGRVLLASSLLPGAVLPTALLSSTLFRLL